MCCCTAVYVVPHHRRRATSPLPTSCLGAGKLGRYALCALTAGPAANRFSQENTHVAIPSRAALRSHVLRCCSFVRSSRCREEAELVTRCPTVTRRARRLPPSALAAPCERCMSISSEFELQARQRLSTTPRRSGGRGPGPGQGLFEVRPRVRRVATQRSTSSLGVQERRRNLPCSKCAAPFQATAWEQLDNQQRRNGR